MEDRVIVLESQYCGHCKTAKPDFIKACNTYGITPLFIDLSTQEGLAVAEEFSVIAQFTPTFIIGCRYYAGARDYPTYDKWLGDFYGEA